MSNLLALSPSDPTVIVNLDNICHNFELMQTKALAMQTAMRYPPAQASIANTNNNSIAGSWPAAIAVIKSNAYGHDLRAVASALVSCGAAAFAIGTVEEGATLAEHLHSIKAGNYKILALLGAESAQEVAMAIQHGITVCLHRQEQLTMFKSAVDAARKSAGLPAAKLSIALKIDSGMHRLGFRPEQALAQTSSLFNNTDFYTRLELELVFTHFSSADVETELEFSHEQAQNFISLCAQINALKPGLSYSLQNTAGLLNWQTLLEPKLELLKKHNLPLSSRPGLALYGSNPLHGTTLASLGRGLRAGMELVAPVLEVKDIKGGASVSYGRTFKAPHDMRIAIIRTGYADGYPRILSGAAPALVYGERTRILGRVCMQMFAVEVPRATDDNPSQADGYLPLKVGDFVTLLGENCYNAAGAVSKKATTQIRAEELSSLCGSIPYELYCTLGVNRKVFTHNHIV